MAQPSSAVRFVWRRATRLGFPLPSTVFPAFQQLLHTAAPLSHCALVSRSADSRQRQRTGSSDLVPAAGRAAGVARHSFFIRHQVKVMAYLGLKARAAAGRV